ncbi:hypothetical protein O3P69_015162 [Scylla paramamosain]|uniref:Sulfotransferase domain-containing protein n=1 Tax=Scylla paramamosain TaxID=85552 RepID=A0AAW0T3G1_SCYPA
MRAPRCLVRLVMWLGAVVIVAVPCTLLLLLGTREDNASKLRYFCLLRDPNAPVILVADDADDGTRQQQRQNFIGQGHVGRNYSLWTTHQGLQQTGSSLARLFLVYALPHGGGGLVSEAIFNVHPKDVFFLYEPLHNLPPITSQTHMRPVEWLQLMLNCSLGVAGHLHLPHLWKSSSFRFTHTSHCHPHQVDMAKCVTIACKRTKFRAVFTTQLTMAEITELLTAYQHLLKVVMVVRDPRALLATHFRSHPRPLLWHLQMQAERICITMAAKISSARSLQHRFPGAVLVLHHEHLVSYPVDVLDAVNQFLGFGVSHHQLAATLAILGLDAPEQERLQLINMWQLDFTLQEVRQVDKSCSKYYRGLEYLPVPYTITTRNNFFVPWLDAKL